MANLRRNDSCDVEILHASLDWPDWMWLRSLGHGMLLSIHVEHEALTRMAKEEAYIRAID